jgi:hypothetical protein
MEERDRGVVVKVRLAISRLKLSKGASNVGHGTSVQEAQSLFIVVDNSLYSTVIIVSLPTCDDLID